jgi:sulfate transport system permease protein
MGASIHNSKPRIAAKDPLWVRILLIGLSFGFVGVLLVLPLTSVFVEAFRDGIRGYLASFNDEAAWQAIKLTAIAAGISVPANLIFGVAASWAIARFEFVGKSFLISLIDLPFAISPVISGTVPGIVLATIFVTFPFVARELIPLMQEQGSDEEQAAISLGAGGLQTFWRVTLPNIKWGLLYGVVLCNARAMGEFGAVSVVSGHIRGKTNTLPLHIEILYNEYNAVAAFAMASILAMLGLVTLAAKSFLEWKVAQDLKATVEPTT